MGIDQYQAKQKYPFNIKNILFLSELSLTLASDVLYLIHDANDFRDYTISIFSICTMTVAIVIFATIMAQMRHFFDFLNETEKAVEKSIKKYCYRK